MADASVGVKWFVPESGRADEVSWLDTMSWSNYSVQLRTIVTNRKRKYHHAPPSNPAQQTEVPA